jgi:hypothetical protein
MLLEAGVTVDALSNGLPAFFAAAADAYQRLIYLMTCDPILLPTLWHRLSGYGAIKPSLGWSLATLSE